MPIKDESQQQSAGRQHPIPQNVMDVEFRVVGDLTVRQLMYLFAGGTFAYLVYRSELPAFWRIIIAFITVVTTVGVAFVPYEERGLDKWLMSFLKSMTMPTQMVWRKTYSPPAYFLSDYANIIKNEILTLTPAKSRNKLDDYLGQLSETETELDKIEAMRLQNIRMGFSTQIESSVVLTQSSRSSYSPSLGGTSSVETEVIYADEDTSPGRTISGKDEANLPPVKREPLPEIKPEPEETKIGEQKPVQPAITPTPSQQQTGHPPQVQQKQPQQQARSDLKPPQIQLGQTQKAEERKVIVKEIIKDEVSSKKELLNSIEFKKPTLSATSIDRAIINIPSNPRGEIKIRTTTKLPKIIVVQDIKEIETKESSLEKKVGELLDVAKQVRAEAQNAADKQAHMKQNKGRIEFFDTKYQELEKEQEKITSQITASTSQVQQIDAPEKTDLNKQVTDLSTKNSELKAQLAQIQAEITMLKTGGIAGQAQQAPDLGKPTDQEEAIPQSKGPTAAGANLISGIVKNKNGELVENAVVIIKDKDGDAIRALKTNQLGQFKTQTAMQNGRYSVEVIKGGMKFDIIAVEARGEVISPLSIIAFE